MRNSNFIVDHIQPVPDLYGPFWISVTLIFSIAIFGNLAHYVQNVSKAYDNDFGLGVSICILLTLICIKVYENLALIKGFAQYFVAFTFFCIFCFANVIVNRDCATFFRHLIE